MKPKLLFLLIVIFIMSTFKSASTEDKSNNGDIEVVITDDVTAKDNTFVSLPMSFINITTFNIFPVYTTGIIPSIKNVKGLKDFDYAYNKLLVKNKDIKNNIFTVTDFLCTSYTAIIRKEGIFNNIILLTTVDINSISSKNKLIILQNSLLNTSKLVFQSLGQSP